MTGESVDQVLRRRGIGRRHSRRSYRKLVELTERLRGHSSPVFGNTSAPAFATGLVEVEGVDVTSIEFLRTRAWRKVRYRALLEAKGRCECCGASPATGARLNVDHIKPRRSRPDLALDPFNLQVLCDECNAGKGNWDQTDWR